MLDTDNHQDLVKHVVDFFSIVTVVGALINVLPSVAAVLSIVWTLLRIYETKTVRGWLKQLGFKGKDETDG